MADLDLPAYLERIAWTGDASPTLENLSSLLRAHMRAIPFENLDVLLGRGVTLDLGGLQRKLVGARRGGYCFEHVTLFAAVLEALGFRPVRHSARVVLFSPRAEAPRTHMFVTVPLAEGRFVVDPGFGTLAPQVPVPLVDRADDPPAGATHWMAREGDHWALRVQMPDKTGDAWVTTLEADHPVDFEMGNHYTATHPASPFVNRLMLRALTNAGRVTVMNQDAKLWKGEQAEALQLTHRGELRALLATHFGFDLPEVETMCVPSVPAWARPSS